MRLDNTFGEFTGDTWSVSRYPLPFQPKYTVSWPTALTVLPPKPVMTMLEGSNLANLALLNTRLYVAKLILLTSAPVSISNVNGRSHLFLFVATYSFSNIHAKSNCIGSSNLCFTMCIFTT